MRTSILLSFWLVVACGRPLPAPPHVATPNPPARRAAIELTTDASVDGRVAVKIVLDGDLADFEALVFRPRHAARIDDIDVSDRQGTIAVTRTSLDRFALGRRPRESVLVRYHVAFDSDPAHPKGIEPVAEPVELRTRGDDVLLTPAEAGDTAFPLEIRLRTGAVATDGASSFGLGSDQTTTARWSELGGAYFIAGALGSARFQATDGNDVAAWLGVTAFDPRWIAAQTAAVRAAVDAFMGRLVGNAAPPFSTLFVVNPKADFPVVVHRATRGLVIAVDRRAAWTAVPRILVAQALTQRYVGGYLRVGDRDDEPSRWFFSEGFSRAIARDVVLDLGLLDAGDLALELNTLLAASVLSSDPRTLATARGALAATALDIALRKHRSSLSTFVRERLADAERTGSGDLTAAEFNARIAASTDAATGAHFVRELAGEETALPPDLIGPCYRLVRQPVAPFELGFVTSTGQELVVEEVASGSRAHRAGMKVGDVVQDLHYESGRSDVPVEMTLVRGDQRRKVRYLPAGRSAPGRVFERVPSVPSTRC